MWQLCWCVDVGLVECAPSKVHPTSIGLQRSLATSSLSHPLRSRCPLYNSLTLDVVSHALCMLSADGAALYLSHITASPLELQPVSCQYVRHYLFRP